eukprot:CAMPEP_0114579896 /NCGR_PEP_ID=MMETSP0125-20121206/4238_1 /TAXON_ID=485358 ORGANISM="Aristerostoma sp., Strain ATCC 50986" /NCGR_SAMPLE_ID=MMETSP0125 /ASSEMBLY_ACC=CAM_ASM_000245 /LENGTH=53 /DNA_ID=CAMNT_0001771029 /DNA_START=2519 /DNA_END=2680 /DNA_ORIENTATION=+
MAREKEIPDLPIIAVTANNGKHDLNRCSEVGINDYIIKPLDKVTLKKVLKKFL